MDELLTIQNQRSFEGLPVFISKENWYIVEGEKKPCIICPNCKGSLLGDKAPHRIFKDGTIKHSVVCRNTYKHNKINKQCNFHAYVKLQGWTGGNIN